ncbi:hypothetical protein [Chryseobacterium sp. A321]
MLKMLFNFALAFVVLQSAERCDFADWLGEDFAEGVEQEKVDNSTYTYRYKCAVGSENSVEIPNRLSATCKKNWEFFARTYGCNEADDFAKANSLKAQCP